MVKSAGGRNAGLLPLALLVLGCAHSARGLVRLDGGQAVVETLDGQQLRLRSEGEGRFLLGLEGCEVEVEGRGSRRKLQVRDWKVLAGPEGGQPFVGRLALGAGGLVLDDQNTGQLLGIDTEGAAPLLQAVGQVVLITGYVSGTQRIRVVDWRTLGP